MNQILDYNPNKSSGGRPSGGGSDGLVRIFAIGLILFAICLVIGGAYGVYNNREKEEKPAVTVTEAKIEVEQKEDVVVIRVSHDKAIEKLIYSWDSEKENNIKGTGEAQMETEIPLLAGTHTLNICVTDIDGVESTHQEEITSESGEDKIYPVIDLSITDDKKLKITATDETEIDFVTYRWNDGEEMKVEVSEEDNKKIEFEIEIFKGKNDLLIVAVDKNNNSTTETKSFTGVTKPDVTITISADKKMADIKCYHENGIKDIQLNINDIDYQIDLEGKTPTDVPFQVELVDANSTIKVVATSVDDTSTEVTETVVAEVIEDEINITIDGPAEEGVALGKVKINVPNGIKEIRLNINDVDYEVGLDVENPTDIEFDIPLTHGNNVVKVVVVGANGTEKEEIKEIDYRAQ